MRVVIDTSVLISAFLFPESKPALVYTKAKQGEFELCLSRFILNEFSLILKNKFKVSEKLILRQIRRFEKIATIVPLKYHLAVIKERESDNHILETALKAGAQYLVTGDKKHLLPLKKIGSTKIVLPAEFLNFLPQTENSKKWSGDD